MLCYGVGTGGEAVGTSLAAPRRGGKKRDKEAGKERWNGEDNEGGKKEIRREKEGKSAQKKLYI